MLIAKPVLDKQFWILQENDRKVGNIEACAGGYQVKIDNKIQTFKTIRMVAQRANIHFESKTRASKSNSHMVHGFPCVGRAYNPVWDVPHQLPLYTKTKKSKSWFAAGWYAIKRGRAWKVTHDPKLITLQRYPYQGPFHNDEAAHAQLVTNDSHQ